MNDTKVQLTQWAQASNGHKRESPSSLTSKSVLTNKTRRPSIGGLHLH